MKTMARRNQKVLLSRKFGLLLVLLLCILSLLTGTSHALQSGEHQSGLMIKEDITEKQKHEERIRESILAMGEADLVDADASPEQRKLNTIVRSLLRLPPEELSYLPLPLTETTTVLENTPEAALLLQAWTQRQLELQEALKHVVKPAESMTKLMQSLFQDKLPRYLSLHTTLTNAKEDDDKTTSMAVNEALYQQDISVIKDTFANLEEFLADIDNARDFHILGLWPQLLSLLDASYPPLIRSQAAWVVGSAVQGVFAYNNNDKFVRVNTNGEENIEENHEWLFEEFNVQQIEPNYKDDNSNKTTGLKLLLNMLRDYYQTNHNSNKDGLMQKYDDEFVKKSLYALAAALRGSFETQMLVQSLMDTDYPELSNGLLSLVKIDNKDNYLSLEPMKRVWALAGDLAQELIVVAEEFARMFQVYQKLLVQQIQESNAMTNNSSTADDATNDNSNNTMNIINQHHENLQQAILAMRRTSFLYPQLFPEASFFAEAKRSLLQVMDQQHAYLTQHTATLSEKHYQGLRALRRELLRYVSSHVTLAGIVMDGCDRFMSPGFSLWQEWFPSFVEMKMLKNDLLECVDKAKEEVLLEKNKMLTGDGWKLGEDESVLDLIQQSELLLHNNS